MMSKKRGGAQVDDRDEELARAARSEERWKCWDEVLDEAQRRYEGAKRSGTLIPTQEIDRALDEIRGRGK